MNHPLHRKVKKLARIYLKSEPLILETLMLMAEENLFIKMDYTGVWEYAMKELGFSDSQAGYFQRVAQRARFVPELKEAVLSGTISLSQARRIVGVIDNTNAKEWITAAIELKQKDLERKVAEDSPRRGNREGFVPLPGKLSKLTVVVTEEQERKIERAQSLASQKLQKPASLQDTVDAAFTLYINRNDPVKKAERASSRMSKKIPEALGRQAIPAE